MSQLRGSQLSQLEVEPVEFTILFQFPDNKGVSSLGTYEHRAKVLDKDSPLFHYLTVLRHVFIGFAADSSYEFDSETGWIPQLELLTLRDHRNSELLQRRADKLHLTEIDLVELGFIANKLVIYVDPYKVESHGPLHFHLLTFKSAKKPTLLELTDIYRAFRAGGTFSTVV